MSKEISLVFNTVLYQDTAHINQGISYVWVSPPQTSPNHTSRFSTAVHNWALVLDRKDPTKPALFAGDFDGNTTPPAALSALMSPDNILLYMCAGTSNDIPQGDLFTMLKDNGGGSFLQKLETLAYFNGSGMTGTLLYTLVSVPGSNLPGIEHLKFGHIGPSQVLGTQKSVISLVPGANGYAPVEVG